MRPSAYKHIAAWCRVNGIKYRTELAMRKLASEEGAPIDAVYRVRWGDGMAWAAMDVVGTRTRMAVEIELNRGRKP